MSLQVQESKSLVSLQEPLTVDKIFPRLLENGQHYIDWFLDRDKIDRASLFLQGLKRALWMAKMAAVRMAENVDATTMPSPLWSMERYLNIISSIDETTPLKVWLFEKGRSWMSPHELFRRELKKAEELLQDVAEVEYEIAYKRFKLIHEPEYIARYGRKDAKIIDMLRENGESWKPDETSIGEGLANATGPKYRWQMIIDYGGEAQNAYDRIRKRLWDAEIIITGILEASLSYSEEGLKVFDKRSREIMAERKGKETVMIERTTG